jgi:WD40 repeat protein
VNSVAFSSDGRRVVCGCGVTKVEIWNVETAKQEKWLYASENVRCVTFSPDGSSVMCGLFPPLREKYYDAHQEIYITESVEYDVVEIWNVKTGPEREKKVRVYAGEVCSLAFSMDTSRVVCGFQDGTVQICNV